MTVRQITEATACAYCEFYSARSLSIEGEPICDRCEPPEVMR